MADAKRILFLCTGNSCRSQMAEGWGRQILGKKAEVHSAGTVPTSVDQTAARVMKEAGVDISDHRSKSVEEFLDTHFDYVITVCDSAYENCPVFPGRARLMHKSFPDPPALTIGANTDDTLAVYRKVRDDIRAFIEELKEQI